MLTDKSDIPFRQLLETINSMVCIIQDGVVKYVNQALSERTHYAIEDIQGKEFTSFFPMEEKKIIETRHKKRLAGEEVPDHYETKAYTATGEIINVDLYIKPYLFHGKGAILAIMSDITRRKKAEEELLRSEAMFRNLVENQGEGIGISDLDDIFTFANPAAHQIFGVEQGALIGKSLFDFLDEKGKQKIYDENKKREKGEKSSYNLSIFTPENKEVNILITATPNYDKEGNHISTLGIFRDMTEEHHAKDNLVKSQKLLESVIFGADAGIWEWDYPTNHLTVNERFFEIIGRKKTEEKKQRLRYFQQYVHPHDKEHAVKDVIRHIKGYSSHLQMQLRMRTETQSWTWVQIRGRITSKTASGKPLKISGTILNINELKQSRIELEHRIHVEKLLTDIIGLLVNVTKENFDQEITHALTRIGVFLSLDRVGLYQFNTDMSALENSHEWCAEGICNSQKTDSHIISARYKWWFKNIMEKDYLLINNPKELPEEATHERIIFAERNIRNMLSVPLRHEGRVLGFLGLESKSSNKTWTTDDINAMKAIAYNFGNALEARTNHQNLLQAKIKAEESDKVKTAFLATMNHELRTPLNHILGISEIIKASTSEKDVVEFAEMIQESGQNLLTMIEDIFHIADIEKGLVAPHNQTFRGMEFFMENKTIIEKQLKIAGKEDAIQLKFKPDKDLLMSYITADNVKINLVLHKLFNNAVKYTHKGEIEFGFEGIGNDKIRFWVRDTGIGIPKEQHKVIFDLFRQGDTGLSRQYGGIGAGLAITAKVVAAMKGKIFVDSMPEKGSTFYVIIPAQLELMRMG